MLDNQWCFNCVFQVNRWSTSTLLGLFVWSIMLDSANSTLMYYNHLLDEASLMSRSIYMTNKTFYILRIYLFNCRVHIFCFDMYKCTSSVLLYLLNFSALTSLIFTYIFLKTITLIWIAILKRKERKWRKIEEWELKKKKNFCLLRRELKGKEGIKQFFL